MHFSMRALLFATLWSTAGCGSTVTNFDGSTDVATDSSNVVDASASDTAPPMAACPATEPASGSACPVEGARCTFGDDPAFHCRDVGTCTSHQWQIVAVDCSGRGMCPASQPSGMCSASATVCPFADGTRCSCTNCAGGPCTPEAMWVCTPPPADANCPRTSPQIGAACSNDGLECDYGACVNGWKLRCAGGTWSEVMVPCPR